jgi:hypothetical protein
MRVGGYQIGSRALLGAGLLLALLLAFLVWGYLGIQLGLRSGSQPHPLAPPSAHVPTGVQFSGGHTFQPKQLAAAPPQALASQARKAFLGYRLLNQRPAGLYWLGSSFHGLRPYLPPPRHGQQFIVYTTPQLFAKASGVYVTTLSSRQGLGAELLKLLQGSPRVSAGRYGVLGAGVIALEPHAGTLVEVSVLGSFVRQTSPRELAEALR